MTAQNIYPFPDHQGCSSRSWVVEGRVRTVVQEEDGNLEGLETSEKILKERMSSDFFAYGQSDILTKSM